MVPSTRGEELFFLNDYRISVVLIGCNIRKTKYSWTVRVINQWEVQAYRVVDASNSMPSAELK